PRTAPLARGFRRRTTAPALPELTIRRGDRDSTRPQGCPRSMDRPRPTALLIHPDPLYPAHSSVHRDSGTPGRRDRHSAAMTSRGSALSSVISEGVMLMASIIVRGLDEHVKQQL